MNNRLKYKGWHKKQRKMIDLEAITPLALEANFPGKGIFIPFCEDIIIIQPIGAKDISGKLIYEGDIIKEGDGHIQVVEWDEEYAGYGLHTKHYSYEILGNIYQNSELLKK